MSYTIRSGVGEGATSASEKQMPVCSLNGGSQNNFASPEQLVMLIPCNSCAQVFLISFSREKVETWIKNM